MNSKNIYCVCPNLKSRSCSSISYHRHYQSRFRNGRREQQWRWTEGKRAKCARCSCTQDLHVGLHRCQKHRVQLPTIHTDALGVYRLRHTRYIVGIYNVEATLWMARIEQGNPSRPATHASTYMLNRNQNLGTGNACIALWSSLCLSFPLKIFRCLLIWQKASACGKGSDFRGAFQKRTSSSVFKKALLLNGEYIPSSISKVYSKSNGELKSCFLLKPLFWSTFRWNSRPRLLINYFVRIEF